MIYKQYIPVRKPQYVFYISRESIEQIDKNADAISFTIDHETYQSKVAKFSHIQRVGGAGAIGIRWDVFDSVAMKFVIGLNWIVSLSVFVGHLMLEMLSKAWRRVARKNPQQKLPVK